MKNIYISMLSLVLLLMACNDDDFLLQEPHSLTDKAFYTTQTGALQGLNAAYDILQLGEQYERILLQGTACSGDAMAGGQPGGGDQPPLQSMMRFTLFPDNLYVNNFYSALYRGIYRANLLISYLENTEDLSIDFDEAIRIRIIGEATFLRGFYHFQLQARYGGYPQLQNTFGNQLLGVPFVDHILSPDEWQPERPELSYTWDKIEEDFTNAAALLPEKSQYASEDMGRATKGAAIAMLAKTHLYQEEWQEAYNAAKTVIESGEYWLEGDDEHPGPYSVNRMNGANEVPVQMSGFKYIWQPEANNSGGSIFSSQHFQEGSLRYPEGAEGNLLPRYYGPRAVQSIINKDFPARTDGPTTVELRQTAQYFWGFVLPTDYFVETAFEDIGSEVGGVIQDPRYGLSVVEIGDKLPVPPLSMDLSFTYDSAGTSTTWDSTIVTEFGDSLYYDSWFNWPTTGRCTWKYFTDPIYYARTTTLADYPQNTKHLRFADLLLIGAEAAVQVSQNGDALTWVNKVRERARNAGNTGYPQALTGAVSVEQILAERRVELAFEGHQFFDIVRTGRAEKILKQDAMQYPTAIHGSSGVEAPQQFGDAFQVGQHEIWPMPSIEIENTNGSISQNPRY